MAKSLRKQTEIERFNNQYKVNLENGCWEWTGYINKQNGYATFRRSGPLTGRVNIRINRLSYVLFIGELTRGDLVCHKCDNRKCVNPFHLFKGTQVDNMQDCLKKGRHYRHPRKDHPSTGYYQRGCRCQECKDLHNEANRIRRKARVEKSKLLNNGNQEHR